MSVNWDALIAKANEGKAADAAVAAQAQNVATTQATFQNLDNVWKDILSRVGPWDNVAGPLRTILQPTKDQHDAAEAAFNAEFAKASQLNFAAQRKEREAQAILQPWLASSLLNS